MMIDRETHEALSAEAGLPIGYLSSPYYMADFAVEMELPGWTKERYNAAPLTLYDGIRLARSLLDRDDLNAGLVARVIRISTGEVAWASMAGLPFP